MSGYTGGVTDAAREHKLPRVTGVKNKQAAPTQARRGSHWYSAARGAGRCACLAAAAAAAAAHSPPGPALCCRCADHGRANSARVQGIDRCGAQDADSQDHGPRGAGGVSPGGAWGHSLFFVRCRCRLLPLLLHLVLRLVPHRMGHACVTVIKQNGS